MELFQRASFPPIYFIFQPSCSLASFACLILRVNFAEKGLVKKYLVGFCQRTYFTYFILWNQDCRLGIFPHCPFWIFSLVYFWHVRVVRHFPTVETNSVKSFTERCRGHYHSTSASASEQNFRTEVHFVKVVFGLYELPSIRCIMEIRDT